MLVVGLSHFVFENARVGELMKLADQKGRNLLKREQFSHITFQMKKIEWISHVQYNGKATLTLPRFG